MFKIFDHPLKVFISLVVAFSIFSLLIYALPEYYGDAHLLDSTDSSQIMAGKMVWQKNNCHTCHQLYGLGGYIGPDLTNVYSKEGYTPEHIKTIIKNGIFQMPAFDLNDREMENLLHFLQEADRSGSAHPVDYEPTILGTFEKIDEK